MEINTKEVEALVFLLDDPNEDIYSQVEDRLLSLGTEVIELLENAWEHSFDVLIQQKLETVIHKIQFGVVKNDLRRWKENNDRDLLTGAMIINRYQYPDLKEQKIINQIEEIRRDAWIEMSYEMSPLEKIKTLNHVFYRKYKFSGNDSNYQDPQNSYLNLVLETRKGNQPSLAIIYSLIARKLDIPVYGVNLPQHFILAYMNEEGGAENEERGVSESGQTQEKVLFYINPFNKGFIFSRNEIDLFLKKLNLKQLEQFYLPCSDLEIIKRIIRNLISSYEKLGDSDKIKELLELADILEDSADQEFNPLF